MHFATMADWLEPAKVQYACSASYIDHVDAVNLTNEQKAFLKEIPDPMFRESARDFMVNQQFRSDYWVKGARKLSLLEQAEQLRAIRVVLVTPRTEVSLKVNGALGEASMSETIYSPLLDSLADHEIKSIGQLEQVLREKAITFDQVTQAVMILIGSGQLALAQEESVIVKAKKHTEKLNAHLCHKARGTNEITYLASPVTGGGVGRINRFQQSFLLALTQGRKQPQDWAQSAWQILAAQGQKLVKESKTLETAEENMAELTAQAQTFAEKQMPILKALQIA